jgi:YgiT-type zinc finger domain-containing protein
MSEDEVSQEMANEAPPETGATPQTYVCPECHAGVMHLEYLTYFTWLSQELITVPNFPSWVCDVCGRREYDHRAITWLNTLLQPNAGERRSARQRRRIPDPSVAPDFSTPKLPNPR